MRRPPKPAAILPAVESDANADALVSAAAGAAAILRTSDGRFKRILFLCPSKCGEVLSINLDPRNRPVWRLVIDGEGKPTLYPSVWRTTGCGAHFIVRHGAVWMLRYDATWPQTRR